MGPLMQEVALLGRIEVAAEDLLARCLENYYALSEAAPSGIAESGAPAAEQPAPALLPAVELCRAHTPRLPALGTCMLIPSTCLTIHLADPATRV